MSLLLSNSNPYEFIAYVSFGDSQQSVRYDISDLSLNLWNYEPIYGAILNTQQVQAPVPQGLYLYESFLWVYPQHGPVVWDTCVRVDPTTPDASAGVPEPSSRSFCILAVLVFALALIIRGLRKQSYCGWGR